MDDDRDQADEHTGSPPTGRVRIVGAEQAGHRADHGSAAAGESPPDAAALGEAGGEETPSGDAAGAGEPGVPAGQEVGAGAGRAGADATLGSPAGEETEATALPHWTEAPTGEVPAALIREAAGRPEGAGDAWTSLPGPTWREEHADWAAHEETFDHSMLGDDEPGIVALGDSAATDRQPWTFELPPSGSQPAVPAADAGEGGGLDDRTAMIPAVGARPAHAGTPDVAFRFDEIERPGPQEALEADELGGPEPGHAAHAPPGPAPVEPGAPADRIPDAPEVPEAPARSYLGTEADHDESRSLRGRRLRRAAERADRAADLAAGSAAEEDMVGGEPRERLRGDEAPAPTAGRPRRMVPRPPGPGSRPPARPAPTGGLRPPAAPASARSGRNLPAAVASGLVIGVITLVFFKLGTVTAMIVATLVVTLAAAEVFAAFRKGGYHPATLLGLVATVSLMIAAYNKGLAALPLVLVLLVVFTVLWHLAGVERGVDAVQSTSITLLAFCWVGVFGSFAGLLLSPSLFPDRHGIAFLLGAVIAVVAYDVAALGVGAWVGSHPLAPRVSPNKTWEGLIGGALAAFLVSLIVVHLIHPWTYGSAAALGLVVAIVSPIGDLAESLFKRHLGIKDMGRILPGHGGVLDRVDGLLFVLPATYYLVRALNLG